MSDEVHWVVVGGGIHGVHLAVRLLGEARVDPERVRILDPAPRLLATWRRCTANTGMRFLRSPAVHHLGLDPWSLLRFADAERSNTKLERLFAAPYDRPAIDLFDDHCHALVEGFGLPELHIRAAAAHLDVSRDGVTIQLTEGPPLRTRYVLLAMGAGGQPRWPTWANAPRARGARVHHIFEPDFVLEPEAWPERVVVVGGGITAAQAAMRLADAGRQVHLIARREPSVHQFDSDPGWVGPKNMRRFSLTKDPSARREMIRKARHVGSVSPDVQRALRRAIREERIHWHRGEPDRVEGSTNLEVHVGLERIRAAGVLLATGFASHRPGGALVDELVEGHALPCGECGYPIVDTHLRWHPRVFVTGPLAELEIGPVARNIVGARRAADRIMPVASTLSG